MPAKKRDVPANIINSHDKTIETTHNKLLCTSRVLKRILQNGEVEEEKRTNRELSLQILLEGRRSQGHHCPFLTAVRCKPAVVVFQCVQAQVIRAREHLVAHHTLEWLFPCVPAVVTRKLIRPSEGPAAPIPGAREGLLPRVDPLVGLEVGALGVELATCGEVTAVHALRLGWVTITVTTLSIISIYLTEKGRKIQDQWKACWLQKMLSLWSESIEHTMCPRSMVSTTCIATINVCSIMTFIPISIQGPFVSC